MLLRNNTCFYLYAEHWGNMSEMSPLQRVNHNSQIRSSVTLWTICTSKKKGPVTARTKIDLICRLLWNTRPVWKKTAETVSNPRWTSSLFGHRPGIPHPDIAGCSQMSEFCTIPREFKQKSNSRTHGWQHIPYCAFSITKGTGERKGFTSAHRTRLIFKYRVFLSKGNQNHLTGFLTVPRSLGSTEREKIVSSSFPKDTYLKEERKQKVREVLPC